METQCGSIQSPLIFTSSVNSFFKKIIYFIYEYSLCVCMFVYLVYECLKEGQKRASQLGQALWVAVSHCVDAGSRTLVSL